MLLHIMRQTYVIVAIGIVFLVVFVGLNIASNNSMKEQVQNVQYLNQYRLGSKNLTSAVQSYAVTGDSSYSDAYNKELNKIAEMSQGLVPLEEQAMEAVQSGDIQTAESLVFGEEYEQTAQVQTMVQMMDQFEI